MHAAIIAQVSDTWTEQYPYLVKTPEDYEMHNLRNMEKYRQSTHSRQASLSTRASDDEREHNKAANSWLNPELT